MEKYYTYSEAAEALGISYRLVQRYVAQGRLGTKLPSGYIITQKDIDEFDAIPRKRGRPKKSDS